MLLKISLCEGGSKLQFLLHRTICTCLISKDNLTLQNQHSKSLDSGGKLKRLKEVYEV